jgi:hypothetical protein
MQSLSTQFSFRHHEEISPNLGPHVIKGYTLGSLGSTRSVTILAKKPTPAATIGVEDFAPIPGIVPSALGQN